MKKVKRSAWIFVWMALVLVSGCSPSGVTRPSASAHPQHGEAVWENRGITVYRAQEHPDHLLVRYSWILYRDPVLKGVRVITIDEALRLDAPDDTPLQWTSTWRVVARAEFNPEAEFLKRYPAPPTPDSRGGYTPDGEDPPPTEPIVKPGLPGGCYNCGSCRQSFGCLKCCYL